MEKDKNLDKNVEAIKSIGSNNLSDRLKANAKHNMRGALIGAGVGVIAGIYLRKNPYIAGVIGLVFGRLLLSKKA